LTTAAPSHAGLLILSVSSSTHYEVCLDPSRCCQSAAVQVAYGHVHGAESLHMLSESAQHCQALNHVHLTQKISIAKTTRQLANVAKSAKSHHSVAF